MRIPSSGCMVDFPLTKSIHSNVSFIELESDHTMHVHVSILHAVLEIIVIDKCHLCLVILIGHMQECMVILIKRPVNDQWQ